LLAAFITQADEKSGGPERKIITTCKEKGTVI
jgi:hypothetical protein